MIQKLDHDNYPVVLLVTGDWFRAYNSGAAGWEMDDWLDANGIDFYCEFERGVGYVARFRNEEMAMMFKLKYL
jgi:hypothetical protein